MVFLGGLGDALVLLAAVEPARGAVLMDLLAVGALTALVAVDRLGLEGIRVTMTNFLKTMAASAQENCF